MECTGKVKSIMQDISGNYNLILEVNSSLEELLKVESMDKLSITLKQYKKRRSLDANAYFHVLVGKIADVLRISKTRCKNILITRYGQPEMIDDEFFFYKSPAPVSYMLELEHLHTLCIGSKEENGKTYNFYKVYRGSHTYNTEEMSVLIDGTIQEAKDLGIETMTPNEIERMKKLWKGGKNG